MVEILPLADADPDAVIRQDERGFGFRYDRLSRPVARADLEEMRGWVAVDRGDVVAFVGARAIEVTLPGPCPAPAAGVTWVSVAATHRRQGLASRLMARLHEQALDEGEAVAVLFASEGGIYRRFGYGPGTERWVARVLSRQAELVTPFRDTGRVRYVEASDALGDCQAAYERYRRGQPGAVTRRGPWWQRAVSAKAPQWLVHEDAGGVADAFAVYSTELVWDHGHPANRVQVEDLVCATDEAREALWRVLLGLDLVASVDTVWLPPDDPLRWQLADPRALRTLEVFDGLWACPLDPAAALRSRRYAVEGCLVLDVAGQRLALEAGPDGAAVRPTGAEADLALGRPELGSLLLGGVRATTLARAGRVGEHTAGAAARADALFLTERAPHCNTPF